MIYQEIGPHDFVDAFAKADRASQFSREALMELHNFLEDLGQPIELDVIALCCDWVEYTPDDIIDQYGYLVEREEGMTDEDYFDAVCEEMSDRGVLLSVGQAFEVDSYLFNEG